MKKFSILLSVFLMLTVISMGVFTAFAETQPLTPTDPVTPVPTDVVTDPVTDPVIPTESIPATGSTDVADPTDPSGVTEPSSIYTEPVTEFTRPTEYDDDNQPNTYSDYVSPAPIYTPSDQDFQKNDWEEIELDIKANDPNSAGVGDFSSIKNNTSKGDEKSPLLLILCIVFWCLALSCLTFVILYKPKTGAKKAVASASSGRPASRRTEPKVSDDYNDGF
ncbi:MAG: hypothetical protein IJ298_05450 [Ruminococcus sp.]|nr:hypothetical protein [Ruminococcus sp.]